MRVPVVVAVFAFIATQSLAQGPARADTSRPRLPPSPNLPSDSTVTVEGPGYPRAQLLYYRNIIGLVFDDTTKGTTIRGLLQRYGATIIGGVPGPAGDAEYVVRIPDPGQTLVALDSILRVMASQPGVARASRVHYRTPVRLRGPTRPPIPALLNLPAESTFTVEVPGVPRADGLLYRNIVGIIFDDTTSGAGIRGLLARYGGTIIGGVPGAAEYIVQIPDPGATFRALERIVAQLNDEPGVKLASEVTHRWTPIIDGRSPEGSSRDSLGPYGWPILTTIPVLDTSKVVALPDGRRLYRSSISLRFKAGISDSAKAEFFRRHSMQVIGVTRSPQFFVRIPDPGRPADKLFRMLERLRNEPEVENAAPLMRDPLAPAPGLARADTSRPRLPPTPNLPSDSTYTVEVPGVPRADGLYYRNIVGIIFDDTTSGAGIRGLLARYGGTIIGGVPGDAEYIVQIPDPGPTFQALEAIVAQFDAEPCVNLARKVYHRWKPIIDGRSPND